jgi:tagatose-1,6-bisphosphate aldolase
VKRAREDLAEIDAALAALEQETRTAMEKVGADDPARAPLEVKEVRAKKADVAVQLVALGWVPGRG